MGKKDLSVHFTSKSQTWNTPYDFWKKLDDVWHFTLDAAAVPESALTERYFTPETDGLNQDWGNEIVWCNPPYDDIKTWTEKCYLAYTQGATVLMLIPSRTDTKAFQDIIFEHSSCTCFVRSRLKFSNPVPQKETEETDDALIVFYDEDDPKTSVSENSAPFPSAVIVFDDNLTSDKLRVLDEIGKIMTQIKLTGDA